VHEGEFDQREFFRSIAESGVRALLIGRRALIVLGAPVGTFDYDFWIHIDDIERFNAAVVTQGLVPNHLPSEARQRGRYVLENSERVDVLVARVHPTIDGERISFDDLWTRRKQHEVAPSVWIALPTIADLMATKKFGGDPKTPKTCDSYRGCWLERMAMSNRFSPPSPSTVRELRDESERRLSADEFNAWVNAPMSDAEREEIDSLIDWFTRRYPTPADRLEYARRAARDLAAMMPASKS
jgi:hypothetical protein